MVSVAVGLLQLSCINLILVETKAEITAELSGPNQDQIGPDAAV